MRQRQMAGWLRLALVAVTLVAVSVPAGVGAAETPFADAAFHEVWMQADGPVASGVAQRSWLWGPHPIGVRRDRYDESTAPGSLRLVQFFDKARMEITDPEGDAAPPWYVTSGLLVKELVSGRRQTGNDSYETIGQPATIPVAGDTDANSPTYADFLGVTTLDGQANRVEDRTGQTVGEWIVPGGDILIEEAPYTATLGYYEGATGHNIPAVFWDWMQDPDTGITAYGPWVYPMGYPISEPYWLTAPIGGVEHVMLVQLYERRVLTWTPDNAPEWQVEMGNVGQHALRWFHPAYNAGPTWSPDNNWIAFTSRRGGNTGIYLIRPSGSGLTAAFDTPYDETDPHWFGGPERIIHHRADYDDSYWAAYLDGSNPQQIFTSGAPTPSPDGHKLAWLDYNEETGNTDLWLGSMAGDSMLATNVYAAGAWSFAWSPDSEKIAFSRRDSDDDLDPIVSIHSVDLEGNEQTLVSGWHFTWWAEMSWSPGGGQLAVSRAFVDGYADLMLVPADGSQSTVLLDSRATGINARFPDWSPASNEIVFEGADGLWKIHAVLGSHERLTTDADDAQAQWSPNGSHLVFIRNDELWLMLHDGSDAHVLDAAPGP